MNKNSVTEAQLVKKLKLLSKEIKPGKEWVTLTKSQILGAEKPVFNPFLIFNPAKLAYAGLIVVFILFGVFGIAQNSLPGDLLYPIKKITEKSQAVFVSKEGKPVFQLKLANEKLADLAKVPAKNLAPALSEFQASVSEAAKEIVEVKKLDVEKIVVETQKLEKNKQKVESLGVVVGETKELDNAISQLVEREIKDLESRTLTEKQQELLEGVKEDYERGNYFLALEKILFLSYLQP